MLRNFLSCIAGIILAIGSVASVCGGMFVEYQWRLNHMPAEGGYVFGGLVGGVILGIACVNLFVFTKPPVERPQKRQRNNDEQM